jgi:hypothetical protein
MMVLLPNHRRRGCRLAMPPFEHALEVLPMSSACRCGTDRHDATRPMCFPGGWPRVRERRWLELT